MVPPSFPALQTSGLQAKLAIMADDGNDAAAREVSEWGWVPGAGCGWVEGAAREVRGWGWVLGWVGGGSGWRQRPGR